MCISGAADQLQSNYAGDFRSILRTVFVVNVSSDDAPDGGSTGTNEEDADDVEDIDGGTTASTVSPTSPTTPGPVSNQQGAATASAGQDIASNLPPLDVATDALVREGEMRLASSLDMSTSSPTSPDAVSSPRDSEHRGSVSSASSATGAVYAQNLDMQLRQEAADDYYGSVTPTGGGSGCGYGPPRSGFYQSEPVLMEVAAGSDDEGAALSPSGGLGDDQLPHESVVEDSVLVDYRAQPAEVSMVETPPPWVKDEDAPLCMGCGTQFTLLRRRHHCRSVQSRHVRRETFGNSIISLTEIAG